MNTSKRICDPRDPLCELERERVSPNYPKPSTTTPAAKLAPQSNPVAPPAADPQDKKKREEKKGSKQGMWAKKLKVLVNKMVGSSQSLIALRVVRSKLRKREETNNNSLAPGHAPTRTHQLQQLQTDGAKVPFAQR